MNFLLRCAIAVILFPLCLSRLLGVDIKIGQLPCTRYGHLAKNSDLFLRRCIAGQIGSGYFLIVSLPEKHDLVANRALLEIVSKGYKAQAKIFLVRSSFFYRNWYRVQPILQQYKSFVELDYGSCEIEFSTLPIALKLDNKRVDRAREYLAKMGLDPDKPIVGVFVRDAEYLSKKDGPTIDRSYHDFRDSDIENYGKAINYLLDSGRKVVRFGKQMAKPSTILRQGFFDYPFEKGRSDDLDIGLFGTVDFIFGSAAGPTDVAICLGIPFLATDLAPPHCVPLGRKDMYIPKKLIGSDSGELISYSSVIGKSEGLFNGHTWRTKYGISFRDNTEDEILHAVQDMVRALGVGSSNDAQEEIDWDLYLTEYWKHNIFSTIPTRLAPSFLRKNRELFFK